MSWSESIAELLAMHAAFRRLGFPAEQLFVATYDTGQVQLMLQRNGQTFTVDIPGRLKPDALQEEWDRAVAWWNGPATQDEKQAIYEGSRLMRQSTSLVMALTIRGFYPIKES